jgi:hypothetical protein
MSYNLFLDDIRHPIMVGKYIYPADLRPKYLMEDWVVVRNYQEFVGVIKKNGLPQLISFDHDLGEDVAEDLRKKGSSKRKARASKKTVKSGYDCAKWLVDNYTELPEILVHSMNPVGAERIRDLFKNIDHEKKNIH